MLMQTSREPQGKKPSTTFVLIYTVNMFQTWLDKKTLKKDSGSNVHGICFRSQGCCEPLDLGVVRVTQQVMDFVKCFLGARWCPRVCAGTRSTWFALRFLLHHGSFHHNDLHQISHICCLGLRFQTFRNSHGFFPLLRQCFHGFLQLFFLSTQRIGMHLCSQQRPSPFRAFCFFRGWNCFRCHVGTGLGLSSTSAANSSWVYWKSFDIMQWTFGCQAMCVCAFSSRCVHHDIDQVHTWEISIASESATICSCMSADHE